MSLMTRMLGGRASDSDPALGAPAGGVAGSPWRPIVVLVLLVLALRLALI